LATLVAAAAAAAAAAAVASAEPEARRRPAGRAGGRRRRGVVDKVLILRAAQVGRVGRGRRSAKFRRARARTALHAAEPWSAAAAAAAAVLHGRGTTTSPTPRRRPSWTVRSRRRVASEQRFQVGGRASERATTPVSGECDVWV